MGMTLALFTAVSSLGAAWLAPRVPQFGMMAAQKRYAEMDRLFWRLTIIVTIISILGAMAISLLVFTLNYYDSFFARRLLPTLPTVLFLITAIIQTAALPMSVYLRAHKKEPLLFLSIFSGSLVGLSTWLLGKQYSALGMAVGYLTISAILLPMVAFVWRRFKKQCHDCFNRESPDYEF
jgi:O-antigen/teichoic acid export membrane protein